MKKLIISLISGAILIGVGIGVLMMEIAEFSVIDTYPEIKNSPMQEFTITDENFFEAAGKNNTVNIYGYLGEYFHDFGKTEVVQDKNTKGVEIIIKYRGEKPLFRFNDHNYNSSNTYEYSLHTYNENIMPKQILDMAEYMCKNKTFVRYQDMYYVEQVIIKTSDPQRINTSF